MNLLLAFKKCKHKLWVFNEIALTHKYLQCYFLKAKINFNCREKKSFLDYLMYTE